MSKLILAPGDEGRCAVCVRECSPRRVSIDPLDDRLRRHGNFPRARGGMIFSAISAERARSSQAQRRCYTNLCSCKVSSNLVYILLSLLLLQNKH